MTEAEWLSCSGVTQPVIRWLHRHASQRKFYLAAVAAVRQAGDSLCDPRSQQALAVVERFADGQATQQELQAAHGAALAAGFGQIGRTAVVDATAMAAAYATTPPDSIPVPRPGHQGVWLAIHNALHYAGKTGRRAETGPRQAAMLRDILGNPFRPIVCDPNWRTGNVFALAEAIYADCAFDRLPILGDALEDAGCTNADILDHCRGQASHVRGCWVVDLVLGKT